MPHSQDTRHMRYETLYIMLLIFASGLFLAGALLDTPDNIARGLIRIVMTEDPLITDYVRLAGVGAALINSSVVTALSVLILRSSGEPANGFTLVVVGLMAGFSLFGKNPVNTWPIVLGTWLYAKSRKEPFGKYAAVALLSSALGPVISYIILDNGWGTPVLGVATGLMIGFVMPSLSAYTYKIQNGMNLYNVGFACGLMAMLLVSLMSSFGAEAEVSYLWATGYNALFGGLLGTMCIAAILAGLFFCRKPVWAAWAGYRRLLQTSGRAPQRLSAHVWRGAGADQHGGQRVDRNGGDPAHRRGPEWAHSGRGPDYRGLLCLWKACGQHRAHHGRCGPGQLRDALLGLQRRRPAGPCCSGLPWLPSLATSAGPTACWRGSSTRRWYCMRARGGRAEPL